MGKSVLQRLAGYLRNIALHGTADPPADGDPGDGNRPRPTAIEGVEAKENRNGNDATRPCAVIGIPYSSGSVDKKETEEESVMKTIAKYMFTAVAIAAATRILTAWGGG